MGHKPKFHPEIYETHTQLDLSVWEGRVYFKSESLYRSKVKDRKGLQTYLHENAPQSRILGERTYKEWKKGLISKESWHLEVRLQRLNANCQEARKMGTHRQTNGFSTRN